MSSEFKKKKRNKTSRVVRKDYEEPEADVIIAVRPSRPKIQGGVISSSSAKRKKHGNEEESVKDHAVNYRADAANITEINRATKSSEIDTAHDQDAQAIFERQQQLNKELRQKGDDGVYRGQTGYAQYLDKKDSIKGKASSNLVRQGPYRAAANIRVTTRWDFQPDICKDYKDTGFCGFGDSCKFVHDRTDYKFGWELERDYQNELSEKDKFKISSSEEEDDDAALYCSICRLQLYSFVRTRCGHCFCEKCALEHHKKNKKCFVCNEYTYGIFTHDKASYRTVCQPSNLTSSGGEVHKGDGKIVNEIDSSSVDSG